jgi:predicted permease
VLIIQSIIDTALQFGVFYGFIVVGYLIAKISGRGTETNKYLNLLLINILIPLLFINTILTTSLEANTEIPTIVTLTIIIHLLSPILMYVLLRRRDYDDSTKGVFYICATFMNALFIPIPLVMMFAGQEELITVIIFSLTQLVLLSTLGAFMGASFGGGDKGRNQIVKDVLTFPPLIAAIIAVFLFISNVQLTGVIAVALSNIGSITTYLALISVGLGIGIRFTLVEIRAALEVVGIRQVLVPLISIPIILVSGLSQVSQSIIILEVLMPPAVLTAIYAKGFNLDYEKAATIVTVGTLLLLPIIPFIPLLFG